MMRRLGYLICAMAVTSSIGWAAPAPVKIDEGDTVVAKTDILVGTGVTLIAASNASRGVLSCTVTAPVRWGDNSITATRGQLVAAGASIAISNTAAVYMVAESESATVSCTEETYSASSGTGVFSP